MSYNPAGPSGSRTVTITGTPSGPSREGSAGPSDQAPPNIGTLRLRGGPGGSQYGKGKGKEGEQPKRKGVVWAEEVVDNEGMGKKKSKICCIYHKPRAFDESSSESDCSSDEGHSHRHAARPANGAKGTGAALRRRNGGGGQVQESEESSESDGGAGDGRARPARKGRQAPKHNHSHDDCDGGDDAGRLPGQGDPAPNRYDIQPRSGK